MNQPSGFKLTSMSPSPPGLLPMWYLSVVLLNMSSSTRRERCPSSSGPSTGHWWVGLARVSSCGEGRGGSEGVSE